MKALPDGCAKNMVAVDTNIVVRLIVHDDEKQWQAVCRLFQGVEQEGRRIFLSYVVVLETFWVLEKTYRNTRDGILSALEILHKLPIIEWESKTLMDRFLQLALTDKVDLSDLLIALVAEEHGCVKCLTFDKAAARQPYFEMLKS